MEENAASTTEHVQSHTPTKKRNDWKVFSGILGIIVTGLLVVIFYGRFTGNAISGKIISGTDAGGKLVQYLNARTGGGVSYVSAEDMGNLYRVMVSFQEQEIPVYVTKDGNYFVQSAIPISGEVIADVSEDVNQQEPPKDVPKSDKPKVELFVMTHCPYGTQAEKGLIPAVKALGSKSDSKIRFVHYFIHGEKEEKETYNQVCIREEQSFRYLDYLSCFLEDGNSDRCLTKTGIDKTKLNSCLVDNFKKAKEYYAKDKELSQSYGVQGSPTLIINEVEASSGRDSASYLKTICSAFNKEPSSECSKQLSSASSSPGFGYIADTGTHGPTETTCS